MHSAIYQGIITHRRNNEVRHGFKYPLFMVYLDLDQLPEFFGRSPFWSLEKFNWASFYRQDYLNPSTPNLKQAVQQEIRAKTGRKFDGQIFMLTHIRYLGFCFNPATFYYCYEHTKLKYVVVEVSNTPWNQRHTYVLTFPEDETADKTQNFSTEKSFHVSPFLSMDMTYQWKLSPPDKDLTIYISNFQNDTLVFNAGLKLHRREATRKSLNRILLEFPAVTIKTISGIYWQAFRLWCKGARFHDNPKPSEDHTL